MINGLSVAVIIPALNEEKAIGRVLEDLPSWVDEVIVVDNGSTDRTAEVARKHQARVVSEPIRGYGQACYTGVAHACGADILVFIDADYSDYPDEAARLVAPIAEDRSDFVVGSRVRGSHARGSLTLQQRFGNWLACRLIASFWGYRYTDLGPFRAIRASTLRALCLQDRGYGWTTEMQIRAVQKGYRILEVPVSYRPRIGRSKISGTVRGVVGAGFKILLTIFRCLR
ncbi:MAG TPA: glycosyltransferase family 2 protein [Acidobacteriota bacterium]|nr:glycosyltransferase family 2 protein [Acidobacteriota bacterium]